MSFAKRIAVLTPSILLAISLCINALQARRLHSLIEEPDEDGAVRPGTAIPDISVRDASNRTLILSFSKAAKPSVVYAFRPSCSWCTRNAIPFKNLTALIANRYRVIGLALGSSAADPDVKDFVELHGMRFAVYGGLPPSTVFALRLRTTPTTIVISRDGFVESSWVGAYVPRTRASIEEFFHLKLPGNELEQD